MEKMPLEKLETLTKAELLTIIGDLQRTLEELESGTEELEKKVKEAEKCTCEEVVKKLTSEKSILRELVEISCRENCPHHHAPEACKNCSIYNRLRELFIDEEEGKTHVESK